MDNGEIEHLRELREIHKKRVQILERQAAHFGRLSVPPHIAMEIGELRTKISDIESQLGLNTEPHILINIEDANVEIDKQKQHLNQTSPRANTVEPNTGLLLLKRKLSYISSLAKFDVYINGTKSHDRLWMNDIREFKLLEGEHTLTISQQSADKSSELHSFHIYPNEVTKIAIKVDFLSGRIEFTQW